MTLQAATRLVPLEARHVPEASELVAQRVAALRHSISVLPERWERPEAYRALLQGLLRTGSGLAAEREGRLRGFLAAWRFDARGEPSVYSPEWGNAATGAGRRGLIEELYAACADAWARDGYRSHLVSLLANDQGALRSWHWLGFGETVADAIRDAEPLAVIGPTLGVRVRPAGLADLGDLRAMEDGLRGHLATSPIFFRLGPPRSDGEQRRRITDEATPILLAELAGKVIGYLRIGPAGDDAATIIRDRRTASISGAFVVPVRRRDGVATQLLQAAIAWARARGYRRLAVDHETANLEASRFWRRQFTYVTYSLVRRLPPVTDA